MELVPFHQVSLNSFHIDPPTLVTSHRHIGILSNCTSRTSPVPHQNAGLQGTYAIPIKIEVSRNRIDILRNCGSGQWSGKIKRDIQFLEVIGLKTLTSNFSQITYPIFWIEGLTSLFVDLLVLSSGNFFSSNCLCWLWEILRKNL